MKERNGKMGQHNLGDRQLLERIEREFRENLRKSSLYEELGQFYETIEKYQKADLCYEQAMYFAECEECRIQYEKKREQLRKKQGVKVPKVAIVMLTYNQLEYTKQCLESIEKYVNPDNYELIIVDNHSTDGTVEWLKQQKGIKLACNEENIGFTKGCNQGMRMATEGTDLLLLNNDTLMMENTLLNLRLALYEEESIGAVGPVTNNVFSDQKLFLDYKTIEEHTQFANGNNIPCQGGYEGVVRLVGFALLIRRKAFEEVGYLDEAFSPGNYEDDDYCVSLFQHGYQLLIVKNAYIYHYGSVSFQDKSKPYLKLMDGNFDKFKKKWNIGSEAFQFPHRAYLSWMWCGRDSDKEVLFVGDRVVGTLMKMKFYFPYIRSMGIEVDHNAAELLAVYHDVTYGDPENLQFSQLHKQFDYVIFPEIFALLKDPIQVLRRVIPYIKHGGQLLLTISSENHIRYAVPALYVEFSYDIKEILKNKDKESITIMYIRK